MPFLEGIGNIISIALALAFIAGFAVVFAGGFGFFLLGLLATGWIPIMMCATDININIGEYFVGTWALWSLWLYGGMSAVVVGLMTVRPDPDGLPPTLKFLAMFYRYDTVEAVKGAAVDAAQFSEAAAQKSRTVVAARMEEYAMKRETAQQQAEAARSKAAAALADAALERELAQYTERELKEAAKKMRDE